MKRITEKSIKIMVAIMVASIMLFSSELSVSAASFYVSGPSQVSPGQSFNVAITASNMYAKFSVSVSGAGVLNSVPPDADNTTVNASVTATGPGQIIVTVSGLGSDYDNPTDVGVSGQAVINVVAPSSGSSSGGSSGGNINKLPVEEKKPEVNLSLKTLKVSKGTLDPAFSPDITTYSVKLPKDSKKISVDASIEATGVSIKGTGEHDLNEGNNKIEVVVQPVEGGESKTYTINVYVEETPKVFLTSPTDTKLGVLSLTSAPKLEGFEDYKFKIGGKEIMGRRNPKTKLALLYMIDGKNNKNYYIYDEKERKVTSIYIPVELFGKHYAVISVPNKMKKMNGLSFKEITIEKQKFDGWVFEEETFKNYSLIYLMNDKAEEQLYQYEASTNTLQLYSGAAAATQKSFDKVSDDMSLYKMLTFGFIGATILLGITSVMFGINLSRKSKREKV